MSDSDDNLSPSSARPVPPPLPAVLPPPLPKAVLEYAGPATPKRLGRPILMIVAGIICFFLGAVGSAINWYARGDTERICALVIEPPSPPAPTPPAPKLVPYDGEFAVPGGLRFADRKLIINQLRKSITVTPDREEMLHRFLGEYGREIFPKADGPLVPLNSSDIAKALRDVRLETVKPEPGQLRLLALVAETPAGQLIVDNNMAELQPKTGKTLKVECINGVEQVIRLDNGFYLIPVLQVQREMDRFRDAGLTPLQAASLAQLIRTQGRGSEDDIVRSWNWIVPGTFAFEMDYSRGERENWILANGAVVPIRNGSANLDRKTGQPIPPAPAVRASPVAAGYLVADAYISIVFSLILVAVSVGIMGNWPYAREFSAAWALLRLCLVAAGLVMGLWFAVSVTGSSQIARQLGGQRAFAGIFGWAVGASIWPILLLIFTNLRHVEGYYTELGVAPGLWLRVARQTVARLAAHPASYWVLMGLCLLAICGHVVFGLLGQGESILAMAIGILFAGGLGLLVFHRARSQVGTDAMTRTLGAILLAGLLWPTDLSAQSPRVRIRFGDVQNARTQAPQEKRPPADEAWIQEQLTALKAAPETQRFRLLQNSVHAREGGVELLLRVIQDGDKRDNDTAARVFITLQRQPDGATQPELARKYQPLLQTLVARLCGAEGATEGDRAALRWFGAANGMLEAIREKLPTASESRFGDVVQFVGSYEKELVGSKSSVAAGSREDDALREFWIAAADDPRGRKNILWDIPYGLARHAPATTPLAYKKLRSGDPVDQVIGVLTLKPADPKKAGPEVIDAFIEVYPTLSHVQAIIDAATCIAEAAPRRLLGILPSLKGSQLERAVGSLLRNNYQRRPEVLYTLLNSDSDEARRQGLDLLGRQDLADATLGLLVTNLASSNDTKKRRLGLAAWDRTQCLGPITFQEYARLNNNQDSYRRPLRIHAVPFPRSEPQAWPTPENLPQDPQMRQPGTLERHSPGLVQFTWLLWFLLLAPAGLLYLICSRSRASGPAATEFPSLANR